MNLKQFILTTSISLLFIGCAGMSPLIGISDEDLPAVQEELKVKKKVLLEGQVCLHNAKTVEEANICNAELQKKEPDFEVDDFTEWGDEQKKEVDTIVDEYVPYLDCIINAKNVDRAIMCRQPLDNIF